MFCCRIPTRRSTILFYVADDGKVVKAVSVIKDNWVTEEVILEELTVFQVRCYYRFVSDGEH